MKRLTDEHWRNFDPWECCGQDKFCKRSCHEEGGCANGCIVPKLYARLARYEDTGLEPEEIMDDARSVVRGKWMKPKGFKTQCQCSECKALPVRGKPNFCPNCGADMREVKHETADR